MEEYVYCLECNPPKKFKQITSTHLKKDHNITVKEYLVLHPDANLVAQSIRKKLVAANEAKWDDPDYKDRVAKTISGVITQQWEDGKYSRTQTEEHAMKRSISAQKTKAKTPEKYSGENNPNYNPEINKWVEENQGKHFCECGCGEVIEILREHYSAGIPRYIKYHHGKDISDDACKKISKSLVQFYIDHPECRPDHSGENNSMYGKKHSPEALRKMSATHQGISYDEWEGFATGQEYCPEFDEVCRESNREKYDRRCFLCDLLEEENIASTGMLKKLNVHHVDMNKNQGCDGVRWKLVPVCMKCHRMCHTKIWIARIEYLLNNVYSKKPTQRTLDEWM